MNSLNSADKDLILKFLIEQFKKEHRLTDQGIVKALEKYKKEILIPVSIFSKTLSTLETIVKYLKENQNLRFNSIAKILNRDQRTIWTTYKNSTKKFPGRLRDEESLFLIPISTISNRKFSSLEAVVAYLHENFRLNFSEISKLLKRDQRTIWTVYSRYKTKYEK